ncbi:MAG: hypothetical protein R3B95_08430 [Nitrospirales bacterium]|nr:hypothetical protein [Nitrospirales bacterium]
MLTRRDAAVEAALEGMTLRDLIRRQPEVVGEETGNDHSQGQDSYGAFHPGSKGEAQGTPDLLRETTQADHPVIGKRSAR